MNIAAVTTQASARPLSTARAADGDYKTKGVGHEVKDADGDYKQTATAPAAQVSIQASAAAPGAATSSNSVRNALFSLTKGGA